MSLLVETIRIEAGIPLNLEFHNQRFNRSVKELFGKKTFFDLQKVINVPSFAGKGIFKCRVEYDPDIRKIEFIPYRIKPISSLKIIEDNNIEYRYKYADRSRINEFSALCVGCDDFLLIRNGLVTDTSYANVVFKNLDGEWVTPDSFLLPGTRRASLIKKGIIKESRIKASDIRKYTEARLINAMIDIGDTDGIPVNMIT